MRTTTLTAGATAPAAKLPVTSDTKGRVRTSRGQRRLILDEFERSGLSAVEFARRSGLKYSTLAGWRQRHRRSQRPGLRPVRLLEAVLPTAAVAGSAKLPALLPRGARLELREAGQIPLAAALVHALAKPC
jgi:transposase-like protein